MKKSILMSGFLVLIMGTASFGAQEFDLRSNMLKLNSELNDLHRGFIRGDKKEVSVALESFAKDAKDLLSNRDAMINMLPKDMKNKKHKVNIAVESAREIDISVQTIREAIENKDSVSVIKRQNASQEAYLHIVDSCFKCHNLVRDKGRISQ